MNALFAADAFADEGAGPLYLQLTRRIGAAIYSTRGAD